LATISGLPELPIAKYTIGLSCGMLPKIDLMRGTPSCLAAALREFSSPTRIHSAGIR